MHLVCPHCQNPIEVVESPAPAEIVCPCCGSTFRLEGGSTTRANLPPGQRDLGKFELLEIVGIGSFGTVYQARDPELDRIVAIKVPRAGNLGSKEDADRVVREARSVAQLRHPSIVCVHEVGEAAGLPYLVRDFVQGLPKGFCRANTRPSYNALRKNVQVTARDRPKSEGPERLP